MGKPDDKQRLFVAGYMKGLNAARTTIRAGHSTRGPATPRPAPVEER